jgi:hypothetical protein
MGLQIYIRSPRHGRYLGENGEWCTLPDRARSFHSTIEAEKFCVHEKLAEVELVIRRENQPPLSLRLKFDL